MTTQFYHHPACLAHQTSAHHPERADRLRALHDALASDDRFHALHRIEAPLGDLSAVAAAHSPEYVAQLRRLRPREGFVQLDADTGMSPGSWEAARRGAGAAMAAVDAVMQGSADNAFCACRPPGHHAERSRAMGFCLFNNAAVAARHAQARHGAGRIAIVDFDVHHGNGTQDIFWDAPDVLYASTHQMPLYPGSGAPGETGEHQNIVNAPLAAGDGSAPFRAAVTSRILPALSRFAPDLLIVSAGFDAHERDPLAQINLRAADFAWITRELMQIAEKHCNGRIVSVLEGGYDLVGLSRSACAHIAALME